MDSKNQYSYFFISFIIFTILGSLLHFVYNMFSNNPLIGVVSPVNESIWEHLKLVFYPCTLFTILLSLRTNTNMLLCFFFSSTASAISMLILGIISLLISPLNLGIVVHIVLYIIFMAFAFFIMYVLYNNLIGSKLNKTLGTALTLVIIIAFTVFTFEPPKNKLFKDPVTQSYGAPL